MEYHDMNKCKLHLKYRQVKKNLHELANTVRRVCSESYNINVPVKFMKRASVSLAASTTGVNDKPCIYIGTKYIKQCNSKYVKDNDYVTSIVNIFHEYRHLSNKFEKFSGCRDNPEDDLYLAISYIANIGNSGYYQKNYFSNPCEIDAEQSGLCNAYNFLKDIYSPKLCEDLIIDYVNSRIKGGAYFIKPEYGKMFNSFHEIQQAFDRAFEQSKRIGERLYPYTNDSMNDEAMQTLMQPSWGNVLEEFTYAKSGEDYDKMIATIVLMKHPEYQDVFPILSKSAKNPGRQSRPWDG